MRITEQGTGPTVLLCHGFPECWYSWRHQLRALAEAGLHAIAPDMRGYGQTDAPPKIERYTLAAMIDSSGAAVNPTPFETLAGTGGDS